jgi:hypothetical protein
MIAQPLLDQGNVKISRHDIVDPRNKSIEGRLEQLLERAERQTLPSRPLLDYQQFLGVIGSIRAGVTSSFFSLPKLIELGVRIVHTNLEIYSIVLQLQKQIQKRPSSLLMSSVTFEDAVGKVCTFPTEFLQSFEVGQILPHHVAFCVDANSFISGF